MKTENLVPQSSMMWGKGWEMMDDIDGVGLAFAARWHEPFTYGGRSWRKMRAMNPFSACVVGTVGISSLPWPGLCRALFSPEVEQSDPALCPSHQFSPEGGCVVWLIK